jgi:hypothetical protein
MNGVADQSDKQNDAHNFNASKLPDLPSDQLKLLRYIMRNSGITDDRLRENIAALPRSSSFFQNQFEETLQALIDKGLVVASVDESPARYRVSLQRKAARPTMKGIWDALDAKADQSDASESTINPALRKTRSSLVDALLSDLNTDAAPVKKPPENNANTKQNARNLMDDLFSTGRSAMERQERLAARENQSVQSSANQSPAKAESRQPEPPTTPQPLSEASQEDATPASENLLTRIKSFLGIK